MISNILFGMKFRAGLCRMGNNNFIDGKSVTHRTHAQRTPRVAGLKNNVKRPACAERSREFALVCFEAAAMLGAPRPILTFTFEKIALDRLLHGPENSRHTHACHVHFICLRIAWISTHLVYTRLCCSRDCE